MKELLPAEKRCVWVVETFLSANNRWYVWHAWNTRSEAWRGMATTRSAFPDQKFRTVRYVSTQP